MGIKGGSPIILVIEDYTDSRTLLSSLLRAKGYKVTQSSFKPQRPERVE